MKSLLSIPPYKIAAWGYAIQREGMEGEVGKIFFSILVSPQTKTFEYC